MPAIGAIDGPHVRSIPGLLAACLAAGIDLFYVALIRSQPALGADWSRVIFLAGILAVAALAFALGSVMVQKQRQVALLAMGAVICWAWAVLALFSIGYLLLAPAVLGTVALLRAITAAPRRQVLATGAATSLLTLGILSIGLSLTWPAAGVTHVVCPTWGQLQGSITTNGSTTHYRCDNGRLTRLP